MRKSLSLLQGAMAKGIKQKTRAELEAELKTLKSVRRSETYITLGRDFIRYGALVAVFYFIYLSVEALAGQATFTNIVIDFMGNVKTSVGLGWLTGVAGVVYGIKQRTLRRDTIERLQGRNTMLEKEIDPRRSSSRLTVRGDTRPEDVI